MGNKNSGRTKGVPNKNGYTVSVDAQGVVIFRHDIYERDPELLDGLDEPAGLWMKPAPRSP